MLSLLLPHDKEIGGAIFEAGGSIIDLFGPIFGIIIILLILGILFSPRNPNK